MGAALNLLLREKTFLGLAEPPDETVPFELLTRDELTRRALDERREVNCWGRRWRWWANCSPTNGNPSRTGRR